MAATIAKSLAEREDDKIQSFNVEFDKPADTVYKPGDTLKGYVKVVIRPGSEPIEFIRKLEIKCRGKCRTEWKELQGSGDDVKYVWHEDAEKYFEEKLLVMGKDVDGKSHLEEGEHQFPFTFQIPVDVVLPPSYESSYGQVRYQVRAKIDKPGYLFDQTTRRCFTLEPGLDLNTEPDMTMPSESEDEKTVCCLCCATGPIKVFAKTDKSGFVPGETILITGMIENNSSREISRITVRLVQNIEYCVHGLTLAEPYPKTEKNVIAEHYNEESQDGCGENRPFEMKLLVPCCPPLIDMQQHCQFIYLTYSVEVEADVSGTPFDLQIKLPITIGTVPLYSVSVAADIPPEVVTQQPTGSQNIHPTPVYRHAKTNGFGINVIYGKRGKRYRYGSLIFSPRYAYYDFTSTKDEVYPHQNDAAYPPHQNGAAYPPQQNVAASHPPQQNDAAYPPQQNDAAYPPQQNDAAYHPQQNDAAYPPQSEEMYPPTAVGLYPQDTNAAYPPTDAVVPPFEKVYPPVVGASFPPNNNEALYLQSPETVDREAAEERDPPRAAGEPETNIQQAEEQDTNLQRATGETETRTDQTAREPPPPPSPRYLTPSSETGLYLQFGTDEQDWTGRRGCMPPPVNH